MHTPLLRPAAGLAIALLMQAGPARCADIPTLTLLTEHAPPASMLERGQVTGRETDKIRAIMDRTGTPYRLDVLPWKRAYHMAQTQPATCVYSTSRTPEREALFKWVGPTMQADWVFYGRLDHDFPLRTLEDARSLRIGTYNGDARDEFLRNRGFQVDATTNDLANPQKLLLKRIDLWAVGLRPGSPGPERPAWKGIIGPLLVFHQVQIYLACNQAVPDQLVERLNTALAELRRDGTLAKIERRYASWTPAPSP